MSDSNAAAELRVQGLVAAARRIADPRDELGVLARRELPRTTGLSLEGVELALRRCLETHPTDREVALLVRSVPKAPRAHVLLSANVFVAAHRAIALALAASDDVVVRPSRRDPIVTELLARAAGGSFRLADRLEPRPGDHMWAYGTDETLEEIRRELSPGVALHAHGAGFGIVVVENVGHDDATRSVSLADDVTDDVILFDQRGCLSPRAVFVVGRPSAASHFAECLAASLARAEQRVPTGAQTSDEVGETARYRDTLLVAGNAISAGKGWVGVDPKGGPIVLPPVGRNVHVAHCMDPARVAAALGRSVTTVGVSGSAELAVNLSSLFPDARITRPGTMQTPPFDGPVDRRNLDRVTGS